MRWVRRTTLTHEQAVQRVVDNWAMFDKLRFDLNLVVAGDDGEHVAIVYQSPMELKDGTEDNVSAAWRSSVSSTAGSPKSGTAATSKGVVAKWRLNVCSMNWATTCWPAPAGKGPRR